jgi:hypothetical protein
VILGVLTKGAVMGIGTAEQEVPYGKEPLAAFADVERAMASIGKVKESDRGSMLVRGTTRFGLQKVRLKVKVQEKDGASVLKVKALADDIWGMGARKGTSKLLEALGVE